MEEIRTLLDSLMGKDRNEADSQRKYSFKDEDVCKFYLIDFCPHDLFPNTKSDIGKCKNMHSEILKGQLEQDEHYEYYLALYEEKFMRKLQSIVDSADGKIEKLKYKMKTMNTKEKNVEEKKEKVNNIKNHICDLLKQAQEAGEKGDLIRATSFNSQITRLQEEIKRLNDEIENNQDSITICQVCGAMQYTGDRAQRYENHINGKQHIGFEKIRSTLTKLKEATKERNEILKKYNNIELEENSDTRNKRNRKRDSEKYRKKKRRHSYEDTRNSSYEERSDSEYTKKSKRNKSNDKHNRETYNSRNKKKKHYSYKRNVDSSISYIEEENKKYYSSQRK